MFTGLSYLGIHRVYFYGPDYNEHGSACVLVH